MNCAVALVVVLLLAGTLGRPFTSPKIFAMDDSDVIYTPSNICSYFAADDDLTNAGIIPTVANECQKLLGAYPAEVQVNQDDNPYKMCLVAGNATFGDLTPVTGQSIIARDFFNNTSNQNVTHQFSLQGTFEESLEMSTTSTVSLSVSVSYGITIPDVFTSTFTMDTTFSSSSTTTQSSKNTLSYDPSTLVNCEPYCEYTAVESVKTEIYSAKLSVDLCLSGYARCQYNDRVNGHYLWYVLVDDFIAPVDRCFVQNGALGALTASIDSSTTFSKKCLPPKRTHA